MFPQKLPKGYLLALEALLGPSTFNKELWVVQNDKEGEMKKIILMFIMAFTMLFICWSVSYADWYMYDNFDDGSEINPNRWDIQKDSNINISIDGGRAKFVHNPGTPGISNSSFLVFNQSPETIKAIRLNLTVMGQEDNCLGDFRSRIGGWLGKSDNEIIYYPYFWNEMSLEIDKKVISGKIYNSLDNFSEYYELFWGKLWTEPQLIYENVYYVTISFLNENGVTHSMRDLHEDRGTVTYTLPMNVLPTDDHFKGIGTISESGSGQCTVFVDDVEVLRDEDCHDIALVKTYTLPTMDMPHGLTFDGTNFWVVNFEPGRIYKLQLQELTDSSIIIQTIDIMDGDENVCMGLTFERKNLWVPCNYHGEESPTIFQIAHNGKIKKSFLTPDGGDSTGLTFDSKFLWNAGFGSGIRKIDLNGNLIANYPSPGPGPEGLAFDGQYLWHSDVLTGKIYKLDTSGNVICSYKSPNPDINGLAFDGAHLWGVSPDGLFKIDIGSNN